LRAAWLGRAHPLGTPLRLHGTNADRAGYFAGLDDRGALLLADDTGHTVAIGAGEVFPTMDGHS
jgi:BirA family biotin operon repressor/biotin-[acetyl-CoA-carboxylase] ligase